MLHACLSPTPHLLTCYVITHACMLQVIAMHTQLASDGHSEQAVYMLASAGAVEGAAPSVHLLPDTQASR